MKPFKNAYDAIKRLLENIKKSFKGEPKDVKPPVGTVVDDIIEPEADDSEQGFEEIPQEVVEPAKPAPEKKPAEKDKPKKKSGGEDPEKKAKEEAEAKAKKARDEEAAARKKAAKERAETEKRVAAEMAREEAEAKKKYDEEVRKRAERAAKREAEEKKAEQRAARRQMEDQSSSSGKTVVDPVTGETVALGTLPAEATYLKKYEKLSTTGDDVIVALNSIQKHLDMPKNIVVLGRNGFGTVKVGEDFARSFYAMGLIKSEKIAKIKEELA